MTRNEISKKDEVMEICLNHMQWDGNKKVPRKLKKITPLADCVMQELEWNSLGRIRHQVETSYGDI